jgi:hypothetical protein
MKSKEIDVIKGMNKLKARSAGIRRRRTVVKFYTIFIKARSADIFQLIL